MSQTTIRRRPPRFGYVQILNAVARDYRVSWRARGLLVELLSYPPDYETSVDDLVRKAKGQGGRVEGRDAMRAAARELKEVGYIVAVKYQDELGRWHTDLEITDDPMIDLLMGDDVSAGKTEDGFPGVGSPAVGESGVTKKTDKKTGGEDEDARARTSSDPSPGEATKRRGGGLRGGRRDPGVTLASRDLIADVVRAGLSEHEAISDQEWTDLAARADAMRPVVEAQAGLSWAEYTAWLRQGWAHPDGRPTYRTFVGALKWRLSAERARSEALVWAAEQRASQEGSGPRGGREELRPKVETEGTCGVHRTALLSGRCVVCDQEAAADVPPPASAPDAAHEDEVPPAPDDLDPDVLARMRESLTAR